jgi:hypothetical protein
MRLNKLFGAIAITALTAAIAMGQNAQVSIHLDTYGGNYVSVNQLSALGAGVSSQLTLTTSGVGAYIPVQVTVRFRAFDHTGSRGISIINTLIRFSSGVRVAEFEEDEAGYEDDRKNANSHSPRGNSDIDGAGNQSNYRDNSASWFLLGGPVAGPLATGKSVYTTPITSTASQALYSFVVWVPNQVGVYDIFFARVLSGAPANTDPTLKTNILGNSPAGASVQYNLNAINGRVEVVPEPASMIALGSGLVGLLALRRRRQA